jgi:hypothetical protein
MNVSERMSELVEPIEQQIMMCDSREEILMMACVMLQRTRELFDLEIGVDGRKKCLEISYERTN